MRTVISAVLLLLGIAPAPQDSLRVPPGFRVSVFAQHVAGVRNLALGPDGVVYAAQQEAGIVVKLPDANHDGHADSAIVIARGLRGPFGLAFRGDTMYVAEETSVKRFDPGAAAPVTLVRRLPTGGHVTRTIAFGSDDKMYVSVGSSCNLCDESDSLRAAVTRFNLDGSGGRVFARGLRNSVGLAFHPATGELWATNNDRDNLGDDVPPERINILKEGGFYGWPQCYLPGTRNPEYANADCSKVEPPAITFQAHSAPLGMGFYTGKTFPLEYQGDAFAALHGSWNRSIPTGAKVIRVRVANGKPVGIQDFITGWQRPNGSRWGRPVSVLTAADGALLVSDDMGDKIWRVTYGR